jgi:wyosine [tRNA(Phe)-imidazoG37] synthetase (radical SAM superfamily)
MTTAFTDTATDPFAIPRNFLGNRFVYATVSPRAKGLSIGVNLNPDKQCNFDCAYCEVNRLSPAADQRLDIEVMFTELQKTLELIRSGGFQALPEFRSLPDNLLQLKHVALSGDGEPTLCPNFLEAVEAVLHLRALGRTPFFKVVLITNASNLDAEQVLQGVQLLTRADEVWAKLDVGTPEQLRKINRTDVPLEKILANILLIARKRPVVIQSLFASIDGDEPTAAEIDAYVERLGHLKKSGAQIQLVQIYSATRPVSQLHHCEHLSLRRLSQIAQAVRAKTGLRVEIF